MDKRTAWVSGVLVLSTFLGLGGTAYSMYHGQAERLNVLQRESKEKDNQIHQMRIQVEDGKQKLGKLQQQIDAQQKAIKEIQQKANF
jgi:TolA-binding protein